MGRYGAGASNTGTNTANTAMFYLDNTTTAERLAIRQISIGIAIAPTTAPVFGLARGTARGTQTGTLLGLPFDPGDTAAAGTLDWCASGTPPTFTSSAIISQGGIAVTAGGVWVFSFWDVPLMVPATTGNGIVVFNIVASGASTGTYKCSVIWDE